MPAPDFEVKLRQEVRTLAARYDVGDDKAFLIWAGERILEIDVDDAYEAAIVGGGNDLGLDFGYVDEETETVVLAQGKFSTDVKREVIRSLRDLPQILSEPEALRVRKANSEVVTFARKYRSKVRAGFKPRLLLLHLGGLAAPTKGELGGEVEDFGTTELRRVSEERSPLILSKPPSKISLRIDESMFFKLDARVGKPRCLILGVPLTELHRLYQEHGPGLLDRNVRMFVGKKTPANKGMAATLKDPSERSNFFYYNNGLCFLAKRIDKPISIDEHVTIGLHEPQIVNGGQTYVTVGKTDEDELEGAHVLARIFCPPEGEAGEKFTDNVIRDTNTQTPVTSRDFHANDPIQKRLLEMFSHLEPPWFYERKVGLWNSLEPKNRVRFKVHDRGFGIENRIIDNEELAKCILAWNQRPALPKTRARKIFEERASEDGLYSEIFPPGCDTDEFVHDSLIAFELNILLSIKGKAWDSAKRDAKEKGDAAKLQELEQDGFVPFFNYFCIASMRYVADKYYKGEPYDFLLSSAIFPVLYEFLVRTFRFVIGNAIRREDASSRIFSLANWFKQDSTFLTEVRLAIDNNWGFAQLKLPGIADGGPGGAERP